MPIDLSQFWLQVRLGKDSELEFKEIQVRVRGSAISERVGD